MLLKLMEYVNETKNDFCPKGQVEVSNCYCLTSDAKFSDVDTVSAQYKTTYFGKCFYGCFSTDIRYQVQILRLSAKGKCAKFNHKGILCGQCRMDMGLLPIPSVSSVLNVVTVTGLMFLSGCLWSTDCVPGCHCGVHS